MADLTFWMVRDLPVIRKGATVYEAVTVMKKSDFDAIVVVENNKPLGIFTEKDLLKKIVYERKNPENFKIEEVMTSPVEVMNKSEVYINALKKMQQKNYRHIPIVDDNGDLVGMVTLQSIMQTPTQS